MYIQNMEDRDTFDIDMRINTDISKRNEQTLLSKGTGLRLLSIAENSQLDLQYQ